MDLLLLSRHILPVKNGTAACTQRGYCGPFANEAFYDAFPEDLWHGMGDCLECGTTCVVAHHVQKRGSEILPNAA